MLATLTDRQRAFLAAYLDGPRDVESHAGRAAAVAGYAWPDKQGSRLLSYPAIAEAVATRRAEKGREFWRKARLAMRSEVARRFPFDASPIGRRRK